MASLAAGEGGAVHVWLESVDAVAEPHALATLDDDERARADRFAFDRDRHRFVARRAFLRRVLAEHTSARPGDIRYRKPATGKPQLDGADDVAFSTSHADGLAIVAVATRGEVGIDIERLRPMPDARDIARRFFAEPESEYLRSLPESARSDAFLRLWTRKEAYVKALGRGLSMPLDAFDVLESVVPPSVRLWPVEVPDGFVATVATTEAVLAAMQRPALRMAS